MATLGWAVDSVKYLFGASAIVVTSAYSSVQVYESAMELIYCCSTTKAFI